MMSEQWPVKTLGELCKTTSGSTPSKSNKNYHTDGTIPWLLSGEVNKREITESKNFITNLALENTSVKMFPPNTVLVAMYGATAGQVGILRFSSTTNQAVCGILPNENIIPEYLYYAIKNVNSELVAKASGSAQPNLSQEKIKAMSIPVPSLEEQQRIVNILDEAFKNIENQTRKTEQKMNTGDEFLNSYIYKIFSEGGKNWTEKTIEETCKLISGQHILAADYNILGNGIGYLTGPADFGIENPVIKRWTEKPKVTAVPGDILITVKGSGVGKINRLSEEEVAISRQLMAIRSNGEIDGKFLFYFISIQYDMFQGLATGAAIPGISRSDVLKLQIPYPPLNEQIRIVKRFDEFTNQSKEFSKICDVEIDSLSELKQSILQEAFNGNLTKEITA
ncbi:MAG: restriction endonuclease subunit S [Candidatus Thalassarchaeaceae archaeon]